MSNQSLIVFIEYRIDPDRREEYLAVLPDRLRRLKEWGAMQVEVAEGTDQPHLFVESMRVPDLETYRNIKEDRMADDAFVSLIVGGREKLHVWAFQPLAIGE